MNMTPAFGLGSPKYRQNPSASKIRVGARVQVYSSRPHTNTHIHTNSSNLRSHTTFTFHVGRIFFRRPIVERQRVACCQHTAQSQSQPRSGNQPHNVRQPQQHAGMNKSKSCGMYECVCANPTPRLCQCTRTANSRPIAQCKQNSTTPPSIPFLPRFVRNGSSHRRRTANVPTRTVCTRRPSKAAYHVIVSASYGDDTFSIAMGAV